MTGLDLFSCTASAPGRRFDAVSCAPSLRGHHDMFAAYRRLLARRPLATNCISTATLFATGDILAQTHFSDAKTVESSFDFARTARAAIYGGLVFAPIGDTWYKTLAKVQAPKRISNATTDTLARVMVDQLGFAPILAVPMYYSFMSLMEFSLVDEAVQKVRDNWWDTLRANWTVWPAFQLANFALVPVQFQLLAVNTISIAWNCYLSTINSRRRTESDKEIVERKL